MVCSFTYNYATWRPQYLNFLTNCVEHNYQLYILLAVKTTKIYLTTAVNNVFIDIRLVNNNKFLVSGIYILLIIILVRITFT